MKGCKVRMSTIKTQCKLLSFLLLTSTSFTAFSSEPVPVRTDHLSIGVGVNNNSMPYTGLDPVTKAVPLFNFQYGPLFGYNYEEEPVFGFELFRHKRIMLAVAATQGRQQLDTSKVSDDLQWIYYGIEDRDKATELGLLFQFYSRVGLVEIMTVRDISNTYDDFRSSISWSRPFAETGNWTVTPRMYGKYYTEKYNTYYYGVSSKEMDASIDLAVNELGITEQSYRNRRPAISPGNTGQFGIDLTVEYKFTDFLKATGYIAHEQLAGQVTSSILTEDSDYWTFTFGLQYEL